MRDLFPICWNQRIWQKKKAKFHNIYRIRTISFFGHKFPLGRVYFVVTNSSSARVSYTNFLGIGIFRFPSFFHRLPQYEPIFYEDYYKKKFPSYSDGEEKISASNDWSNMAATPDNTSFPNFRRYEFGISFIKMNKIFQYNA